MNAAMVPSASPLRYRMPTGAIVFSCLPALMIVTTFVVTRSGGWWFPATMTLLALLGLSFRIRQGLVLDDAGAHVTVVRTHHVPWADVRRFEAGRGGVSVVTDDRSYRSVSPCTGWGYRASDAQVAELEAIRRAHQA
jgi:hypothetical protein